MNRKHPVPIAHGSKESQRYAPTSYWTSENSAAIATVKLLASLPQKLYQYDSYRKTRFRTYSMIVSTSRRYSSILAYPHCDQPPKSTVRTSPRVLGVSYPPSITEGHG